MGGISDRNDRWNTLLELTGLLTEGKAVLQELVDEIESPNLPDALDRGFLRKRKRSPRNPNNFLAKSRIDDHETKRRRVISGDDQTPETSSGGECEQSPKSTLCRNPNFNFTFKKPIGDYQVPESTSGGVECDQRPKSTLCRNPNFNFIKVKIKKPTGDGQIPETSRGGKCDQSPKSNPNFNFNKSAFHVNPMKKCLEFGESSSSTPLKIVPKQRLDLNRHIIDNNIQSLLQPPLPEGIRSRIIETGGRLESAVCVIEKVLYQTDVDSTKCRLSVPLRQVRERFLFPGEVEILRAQPGAGIQTMLIQPCLEECEVTFAVWGSNATYVLKNGWNNVYLKNGLRQGMQIRLWAFRRNSELCLALEVLN